MGLAGLHEGKQLKGFVHRSKATRKAGKARRFFHEGELACEEVTEVDQLGVVCNELVCRSFERQHDVDAERVLRSSTFDSRCHDSGSGTGHDHPIAFGHCLAQQFGALVFGLVFFGAGGSEDRALENAAICLKDEERVAQLLERIVDQLHVASIDVLEAHSKHAHDHLEAEVVAVGQAGLVDQVHDGTVERVLAGAVAR